MKNIPFIRIFFTLFFVQIGLNAEAQNYAKKLKKASAIEVSYHHSYKGKIQPDDVVMTVVGNKVSIQNKQFSEKINTQIGNNKEEKQLVTGTYIDYSSLCAYKRAELPNGKIISTNTPFSLNSNFKEQGSDTYLGLSCKIVRTIINSNTIDVWYTTDIPFRGTPQPAVGVPDGLVLRVVRNGDMIQEATSISPLKETADIFPTSWGETMDNAIYQYTINQSGVITVSVFDQQTVCFNGAKLPQELEEGEQYVAGGGSIILKKIKLPKQMNNRKIFAEVVQYSEGDAYDRTGSIFVIPTDKKQSFIDALHDLNSVPFFQSKGIDYHGLTSTSVYNVPVEIMRFFTGFGVRQYNYNKVPGQTWVDSVLYKTEVTLLSDYLHDEVWIGAYIGNWDAKGHRLSLKLKYYPEDEHKIYKAVPLFNTVNYLEQAGQPYPLFMDGDSLTVKFTLSEAAHQARLIYTTTGHGGWDGGDEFNPKPNTIWLDGKRVITFIPWRDDCATYRNNNPCSGNFSNGLSSSDQSRSNWCPGTVTNPDYIYLEDLDPGEHTLSVQIPQGKPEGLSNSYWCISGTLIY